MPDVQDRRLPIAVAAKDLQIITNLKIGISSIGWIIRVQTIIELAIYSNAGGSGCIFKAILIHISNIGLLVLEFLNIPMIIEIVSGTKREVFRSEERRVGKECRSGWLPYTLKK